MRTAVLAVLVTILSGGVYVLYQKTTTVSVEENKAEVTRVALPTVTDRTLMVTNGIMHSVPLSEVISGGPRKDGIPSIDSPEFVSHQEASLDPETVGIGLFYEGEARFYPFDILVWHEIVNDVVSGVPVAVTYCPLCMTGVVFDRRLDGGVVEFGVSGRLWQSNLLMYDRYGKKGDDVEPLGLQKGESLWSQVLGEAVVGPRTGDQLRVLPASGAVRFIDWITRHPDTRVLARPRGSLRPYGTDPYGAYYTNSDVLFPTQESGRMHPKVYVHGVVIDGVSKAYPHDVLPVGTITDVLGDNTIQVHKSDTGAVTVEYGGKILPAIGAFWFAWEAVHPETEVWDPATQDAS